MKIRNIVPFRKERDEELVRREQDPFYAMQARMNRLFGDLLGGFDGFPAVSGGMREMLVSPRLDVSEDEKAILVTAELPGIGEKDVELLLNENTLTIKGEKKMEKEEQNKDFYRSERVFGVFHRSVELPASIDRDKVEATFKEGVLKVILPKTAETRQTTRKIEVKAG